MSARRDVGRVVFNSDTDWVVLTLACHVGNVVRLVQAWESDRAYLGNTDLDLSRSREYVVQAAEVHDMAKPSHFALTCEQKNGDAKWGYSFAGHRFAVEHPHPYVKQLGLMHHEYSVDGITSSMALLRNEGLVELASHFALDLYTLEMADQIEATVARAAVGSEDLEERVFMDFAFAIHNARQAQYRIDPYPFSPLPVRLEIEFASLQPPPELIRAAQTAAADKQRGALRAVQEWLEKELQSAALTTKEITLWPWTTPIP